MVLSSICISLIFVAGWYVKSYTSGAYILLGLVLWLRRVFVSSLIEIYDLGLFLSLGLAISKLGVLVLFEKIGYQETLKDFLDFEYEKQDFMVITPDIAVVILCVLGRWATQDLLMFKYQKYIRIASLPLLITAGLCRFSFANLFYLIFSILQVTFYCLKVTGHDRSIAFFTSLVSTMQLAYPYFQAFMKEEYYFLLESEESYGLLQFAGWKWVELILIVLVNGAFSAITFYLYEIGFDFKRRESLLERCSEEELHNVSETILNIKYILAYVVGVFMLWVWIFKFPGPSGLAIMMWIFFSIVLKSSDALKMLTQWFLIPVLFVSFISFYVATIYNVTGYETKFGLYTMNDIWLDLCFVVGTIFSMAIVYYYLKDTSSILFFPGNWYGRIFAKVFKKIYIISLVVLFLIGLSDINILHSILMIMCILFMMNPISIKTHWKWLLGYNMFMLFIRYLFSILVEFMPWSNKDFFQVIGLNDTPNESFIPYDYLIWILLFSVSLQHYANQIKCKQGKKEINFIIDNITKVYKFIRRIEIYVMYAIIITLIYISNTNILNFIRLSIVCFCFVRHFSYRYNTLSYNFISSYPLLVVLEVYSGILLGSRYLFQFEKFFSLDIQFPNIGYELFDKKNMYISTASDCGIFIASVFASRNCKELLRFKKLIMNEQGVFYKYFFQPFQYFFIIAMFGFAIFYRLSLTMLLNIFIIGFYEIYVSIYFTFISKFKMSRELKHEWRARATLWKYIFFNNIVAMLLAYFRFLINSEIISEELVNYFEWGLFLCGFIKENDESIVMSEAYGYLIILVLLIVERHCLQASIPKVLYSEGKGWKSEIQQEEANEDNPNILSAKVDRMKIFVFLKSIGESLIPMAILLLAFDKITIISVCYVGAVFLVSCSPNLTSPIILYVILVFMTDVQYTLVLSNINKDTSSYIPSSEIPIKIPWFEQEPYWPSDHAKFLNMGTDARQLYGICYDMLSQVCVLMYYFYLSISEIELQELKIKLTNKSIDERDQGDQGDQGDSIENEGILKQIFIYTKYYFYLFSRLLVVGIVLLFITQSLGLLSSLYCIFCLIFIYKENDILVSKHVSSYIDLLSWFLRFMVIDLTLQMAIQLPYNFIKGGEFEAWCQYIGLMKILNTGEIIDEQVLKSRHSTILFKVYTFTFLFMVYRMMRSTDYIETMEKHYAKAGTIAKSIAKELSENFNNDRISKYMFYRGSKARFQSQLRKFEENLKKLNNRFSNRENATLLPSKSIMIELDYSYSADLSNKLIINKGIHTVGFQRDQPLTARIKFYFIKLINPYLFKDFIDRISPFGLMLSKEALDEQIQREANKKKYYKKLNIFQDNDSESNSDKEVNLNESYEPEVVEYNILWSDYPKLIIYIIASSTEAIVFLCFFLNHYNYASLESIIFPLSTIGYALIDYPRPNVKYFRYMMVYAEIVFFLKFVFQLEVWEALLGPNALKDYKDPLKIGFNLPQNTYSETIVYYVLWDVIVMISLLFHQHYLFKVGLRNKNESEIESLEQAKLRNKMDVKKNEPQTGFFLRMLLFSEEEKPGKDLYSPTIFVQLIILFYIFCCFSAMDGNSINISEAIRTNQFQGRMVGALIVQIALIIIDRYFYLKQSTRAFQTSEDFVNKGNFALYFRVIVHILLLVIIHFLVFWYFPINGNYSATGNPYCTNENKNDTKRCNNFEINVYLKGFYILYMIYLVFAALQIKHGMPCFKRSAFPLMRVASSPTLALFKTYRSIPFFFELRTLIDWVSTETCLTIFQWLKFEDINSQLFINKCVQKSLEEKPQGDPIRRFEKFYMGIASILLLLFIILAPLIVFSTLNPIIEYNSILSTSLRVSLVFNDREFDIFETKTAEEIHYVSENEWKYYKFSEVPELTATDADIMQKVTLPSFSDRSWILSPPAYTKLCNMINDYNITANARLFYTFKREYPAIKKVVEFEDNVQINNTTRDQLKKVICDENEDYVVMPKMTILLIRLPSKGNTISPVVVDQKNMRNDLVLQYNNDDKYWTTSCNETMEEGVHLFTLSDRYSPITFTYSIITLYLSVVLAVGTIVKYLSIGSAMNLNFTDMKRTDKLETLCTGVYVSRMIGDIKKEEELYYELIDILRSTEMTKMITGSSSIKEKID